MLGNKAKDTTPERALRSKLHAMGLRFRKHYSPLPGHRITVDVAFPRQKLAVFVDGCFWHGCPLHGTWPKRNGGFWRAKIERNRERDRQTDEALRAAGWMVVRVWEHEDTDEAVRRIATLISGTSRSVCE
ncbi:MAG: very short patch repair endonuclease [Chloroflexi bacterium]|nr:very short patch repair endonuclease [Chloroflexota bacterium]